MKNNTGEYIKTTPYKAFVMRLLCHGLSEYCDLKLPDGLINAAKEKGFWNCAKENQILYKKIFNEN